MAIFDKIAQKYDSWYQSPLGKISDRLEHSLVNRHIEKLKSKLVLDAGCGTGLYSMRFARKGAYVMGLDCSEEMLQNAKKKSSSILPVIQYLKGDLHYLPFKNNIFDIVASITALEFCAHPLKVISEMGRVLKPNGQLIIGVLNRDSLWMKKILEQADDTSIYRHAHLFIPEELKQIINQTNLFRTISIETCIFFSPDDTPMLPLQIYLKESLGKWSNPMHGAFILLSTRKKV